MRWIPLVLRAFLRRIFAAGLEFSRYSRPKFALVRLFLFLFYAFRNAYGESSRFAKNQGFIHRHTYGETFLFGLEKTCRECDISTNDYFVDLGCGRGLSAFWVRIFIGCRVLGIDRVEAFIKKAKVTTKWTGIDSLEFLYADFLKTALSPDVTFVYLYNPFLSNTQIACLEETFSRLKSGSKILNVGFPLDGWIGGDTRKYVLKKSFEMSFDWGRCTAYLHQVSDTNEAREGRKQWLQKFRKKG